MKKIYKWEKNGLRSVLDRIMLNEERIEQMADAIQTISRIKGSNR